MWARCFSTRFEPPPADTPRANCPLKLALSKPALARQGTRNELFADVTPYSSGSDHDDYDSSTIAVPSLYLRDWPDIYIHTDHDTLDQIDATKLRRVALLGAASGYVYASVTAQQLPTLLPFLTAKPKLASRKPSGRRSS